MLSPLDWLSLSDTCITLRNAAERIFPLVFKEIDLSELLTAYETAQNKSSVAHITKFLIAFGNMINRLKLTLHHTAEKIAQECLDAIVLYCSGTLESFELIAKSCEYDIRIMLLKLQPLFVNLESLSISRGVFLERLDSSVGLDVFMKPTGHDSFFDQYMRISDICFQPFNSMNAPNLEYLQLGGDVLDIIAVEDLARLFQNQSVSSISIIM